MRVATFLLMFISLPGCSSWPLSSKWAMNDADYAEKYSQPYGEDKTQRMIKQLVDARHLKDKGGWTLAPEPAGHQPLLVEKSAAFTIRRIGPS